MFKCLFLIFASCLLFAQEIIYFVPCSKEDLNGALFDLPKGGCVEDYGVFPLIKYSLDRLHYTLKTAKLSSYPENDKEIFRVVLFNLPHYEKISNLEKIPFEKRVLFIWEPVSVAPDLYRKKIHALFPKIFTWDDDLVDNEKYFKIYYPVLKEMISEKIPFHEKKLCTTISAHKVSDHLHELYTERKKAIAFFDQKDSKGFDFYGMGWNGTSYKTYKGTPKDKIEILKKYKFSICYENMRHVRGYVTEKIFDCFAARCVPIYLGAENIDTYVPEDCYIDKRKFSNYEELYMFLSQMSEKDHEGYLTRIQKFLESEKGALFSYAHFAKAFVSGVVSEKNQLPPPSTPLTR